jgi:hypothetical protein
MIQESNTKGIVVNHGMVTQNPITLQYEARLEFAERDIDADLEFFELNSKNQCQLKCKSGLLASNQLELNSDWYRGPGQVCRCPNKQFYQIGWENADTAGLQAACIGGLLIGHEIPHAPLSSIGRAALENLFDVATGMNLENLPLNFTPASPSLEVWIQVSNLSDQNYWIRNVNPDGTVEDLSTHGELPARTLDIKISTWPGAL